MIKGWVLDIQRFSRSSGRGVGTTVLFKGCPLGCLWCENPESQQSQPELFYFTSLCVRCYRCVEVCPTGATVRAPDGSIKIDRQRCKVCGRCGRACLYEARAIAGKLLSVDEVIDIIKRPSFLSRNPIATVTASGGEPTQQPDFLRELFRQCHENGIDAGLHTTGLVEWEVLESLLEHTDFFLFDIKSMDPKLHKQLTGVDNALILENLRKLAETGKPVTVRLPLIRGYSDSASNIKRVAEFMAVNGLKRLDLVPYYQLGDMKYTALGKEYRLRGAKTFREEQVEAIKQDFEAYGLDVGISQHRSSSMK